VLAVTFSTEQTSAALAAGRLVVVPGTGTEPVRPEDRRSSPSIARALREARVAAVAPAMAAARRAAAVTASAAALPLGTLFSVAEVRRPFEDFATGTFGDGRFCGVVRQAVGRRGGRDADSGRRRTVRRRRCFFSSRITVGLRVTYLPAVSGT